MTEFQPLVIAALVLPTLALMAFWLWMFVDCLRHKTDPPQDRVAWALGIVFFKLIGAGVYYFCRYRPRRQSAV